jgi:hypothetical protein
MAETIDRLVKIYSGYYHATRGLETPKASIHRDELMVELENLGGRQGNVTKG